MRREKFYKSIPFIVLLLYVIGFYTKENVVEFSLFTLVIVVIGIWVKLDESFREKQQ